MALDRQRILNELGSVMNQLQSADCGCMGKLFANQGQPSPATGNPMASFGGCRHGGCHGYGHNYGHSYKNPCAGEPFNAMNANPIATGRCNPPKLYADTYSYLNENLMQPVVKDVYNDLRNLTPANTIANNPMAGQMGLSPQDNPGNMGGEMNRSGQGNAENAMASGVMGGNVMQNMHNTPNMMGNQMMGNMAGMGPQIVNMMTGDGKSKPANMEGQAQGGPLTGPMVIDAPNSPHGQVGVTPLNQPSGFSQGQFNRPMNASYTTQGYSNLPPQYQTDQNMYNGNTSFNNPKMNPISQSMAQNDPKTQSNNMNANSAAQHMASPNPHGMHAQGVAKFNEMFPGVMQGLGGDLGFDPMAIAIQMNPANQQKAAMDTMQKIMNGTGVNKVLDAGANSAAMQPAVSGMKAAAASFAPPSATQGQNSPLANQIMPNQQSIAQSNEYTPVQNQQANQNIASYQPQQQIYAAVTGNSALNRQELNQHYQQNAQDPLPSTPQTPQAIDPRYASMAPPVAENMGGSNPRVFSQNQEENAQPEPMIKDPIYPVDTSKNLSSSYVQQKYFDYNTLGQPVEMLPAKMFHSEEPNLPQTLSPQQQSLSRKDDYMKYSNVKSTVSKTSLMANKPVGKVPSRTQLQHIYNQYKGSQSFTHQNIRDPGQGASISEGHLASNQINSARKQLQAPVERVGDMVANNAPSNPHVQKVGQMMGHVGDVLAEKPPPLEEPAKMLPPNRKLRNGLQDMIYTSYPTSAAWSFHGNNLTPYYPGHRNRRKV